MKNKSRTSTFHPATGNPEAHDYLDWYRHLLRTGQIDLTGKGAEKHPAKRTYPKPTSPRPSPTKARERKD